MVIVQCCGHLVQACVVDSLRVLYHCTMCTRHSDLVSLDFDAIPIFPF